MDDGTERYPVFFLTKTEAFVLECRNRGMSETAIRRLLQLSAADAVALGLISAQGAGCKAGQETSGQTPNAESWPHLQGRRKPFARRRAQHLLNRRHKTGAGNTRDSRTQAPNTQYQKARGDKV
ncbi:hypothetical protein [Pelagibius sp. Alg239-R121]|uniref:hypothetical protein n=1 Tax=Pelagibius sp. Alg239-R121 TaxID=2993448 RepID=UPI0024A752E2|nr:hypothetical protein [Pelagibius sp. Alg239-R121]